MTELKVGEKSGFLSQSPVVEIIKDGLPFYKMERKARFIMFNMPIGDYEVVQGILTKRNIIDYPLIPLPPPDANSHLPKKIVVKYIDNPHKCSVDISDSVTMKVFFDNQFKHYPEFVCDWIMGHEMAHYKYHGHGAESEQACDLYSCNIMLEMGLNPSQIQAAIDCALSNALISEHRKELIYEHLKNVQENLEGLNKMEHGGR